MDHQKRHSQAVSNWEFLLLKEALLSQVQELATVEEVVSREASPAMGIRFSMEMYFPANKNIWVLNQK